jgi:hypothetical protein
MMPVPPKNCRVVYFLKSLSVCLKCSAKVVDEVEEKVEEIIK